MSSMRMTILALSLLSTSIPAMSANEWETVRQGKGREDVSTWVRSVDGMAVKAFKGVTEVRKSTLAVLALLADTGGLNNWVYQCKSSAPADKFPADHTYARFKGIWPASDRDVMFRSTVSQQADGSIVVDSNQVVGYPQQDGYVRMPYLHNTFKITPLKGNWTRVEFETQIDLGGLVPAWLANAVSTKAPLVTLEGLHNQAGQARYQIKSVNALPAYYLKGKPIVMPEGHLAP